MAQASNSSSTSPNFERIPDEEDAWRNEIAALTVKLQEKRKSLQNGEVLRGVHPKSHGCLDAEFVVNSDVPENLQVGLFAHPGRRYSAKIRYSNADVLKRADIEKKKSNGTKVMNHGSRGMAIKVLHVDEDTLLADGEMQNQDFLMVNTPEFAFRNVRDYRRLTAALVASEDGATPDLFFLPGVMLKMGMMDMSGNLVPASASDTEQMIGLRTTFTQLHEVFADYSAADLQGVITASKVVEKIRKTATRSPHEATYFSAAPFQFGAGRVMRYSVAPMDSGLSDAEFTQDQMADLHEDYLAQALEVTLCSKTQIKLIFRVQVATADDIAGNEQEMIENAALPWDETKFPFVEVAQLVIQRQMERNMVDACKPLLFTPWHSLADHKPLGGINRLRKPVYSASADFRRSSGQSTL
ncbi:hypothetical protein HW561_20935 [Rhodobacteraceae bacterium B1Z28]|uniref:Catalase n=1 Tax=Ruegeria haliotis TaxID=2747601 RepID=A0ABX2PVP3_9RHOB|nr:hypothetical protein [Ruegeria haliotis]NVO58255.1 hypothetical protein [Ruegeria haliotis]